MQNIEELVFSLKNKDIVVPEFQREYVWPHKKIKELFSSLLKEYPVGGILIWKTSSPPALKGLSDEEVEANKKVYQVLLDGQQRMTTIYMLITGRIPPYYEEKDIEANDPRSLCFNLHTREFKYFTSSMADDRCWKTLPEIFAGDINWPTTLALSNAEKYKKLRELEHFEFDFDVRDKTRAFGDLRTLVESTGLKIFHAGRQIWKISIPANLTVNTILTSIEELNRLHEGGRKEIPESEWSSNDSKIVPELFLEFWKKKIIPVICQIPEELTDQGKILQLYLKNYNDLVNIRKNKVHVQEIPPTASFSDAIDIFDKINSMGENLTRGELALTHITAQWPEARRVIKEFQKECLDRSFDLTLNTFTRLLVVSTTGRGLFETIRGIEKEIMVVAWDDVKEILSYVIDILKGEKINSAKLLNGQNLLIPLFYFLKLNGKRYQSDINKRKSLYWVLMASMWGRYGGTSDTKIEEDLNIIKNSRDDVWDALLGKIIEQRGRLKVEINDLEGSGVNSRFFTIFYIMLRNRSAQDWFNGLELDEGSSFNLTTNRHHIFPRAYLNKLGFSEKNESQRKTINEIANSALITASTNIQISDKSPDKYFEDVIKKYPNALSSQLIPENPELWKGENFMEFLSARRKLIADEMNSFLENFNSEFKQVDDDMVNVYLLENEMQEYKETWQYDVRQSEQEQRSIKNTKLQLACIKTVAAFLNSRGGNLYIGVEEREDQENVIQGLNRDLQFFSDSFDKLHLNISEVMRNSIGIDKKPYYSISMIEIEGKNIFRVKVQPCFSSKTWVNFSGSQYFYVRDGNGTKSLSGEDADNYWEERELINM